MAAENEPPYVDAQDLNDVDSYLYEAIATLEYSGRPTTRGEIATIADLDDQTIDESLDALTDRGALVRTQSGDEPAFEPARRGWSAAPDRRSPER